MARLLLVPHGMKHRALRFAPALALILGCGPVEGPAAEDIEYARQAITGGQVYTGHPSVGMLVSSSGSLCTATLIGKKTVLTAAHCIQQGAAYTFKVSGQSYPSAATHVHPSYVGAGYSYDIALVILSSAPAVSSSAIATSEPAVGQTITLIGYGATYCWLSGSSVQCTQDAGTKRLATNQISQKDTIEFTFGGTGSGMGSTCKGDSGGPAFATLGGREVVVGVTSRGAMPCGSQAIDTRVDAFATWIDQTSGGDVNKGTTDTKAPSVSITSPAAQSKVQKSLTVKATVTDDTGVAKAELFIDGTLDSTRSSAPFDFAITLTAGTHVLKVVGADAAGNKGESSVSVTVEDQPSSPSTPSNPPTTPPGTKGAFGAGCQQHADCSSGICAEDSAVVGKYCTQTCDPAAGGCPDGASCLPTNTTKHVCGPPQATGADAEGGELLGGCAVGGAARPASAAGIALLSLLLWAARPRRRR